MVAEFILLASGAYLLGSVPSAYLAARWRRGIDIRRYGSGNVGASNVLATVSKRWTIPVSLFDLTKGMVMMWSARLLGLDTSLEVIIGLAAIIGHNWSVFLRFRGGRGILTSLGVIIMLSPPLGIIALATAFLFLPFRQLSLGVFLALLSLPLLSWFPGQALGIEERLPVLSGTLAVLFLAMCRRLTAATSVFTASVPPTTLIINRLLFDRDIRDRESWLKRLPQGAGDGEPTPEQEMENSLN